MTQQAKVWLRLFVLGYAGLLALWIVSLTSPIPFGDLTRIGRLSERQFGWTIEPRHYDDAYLHGVPIDKADVVVIGDSFSMTYRWQSVLVKAGYRVTTSYWGQYENALCGDFNDWLARAGFKGKLVILESVERLLDERTRDSEKCAKMQMPFDASPDRLVPPPSRTDNFSPNWDAPFTQGWITYYNTRRAIKAKTSVLFDPRTWVRPVPDGCKYFSNRLCDKVTFFGEDDDNGPLTVGTFDRMASFTKAHSAIPIVWMVVPNKTTVYLHPDFSKEFETAFVNAKLGPDLYTFAQDMRGKVRDFYFPNDTHMSTHGQFYLGERMLQAVREVLPTPPARSP